MPFLQNFSLPTVPVITLRGCLAGAFLAFAGVGAQAESVAPVASIDTPPQVVFEVVLAEIALKRDKPQVAMAAYADLALNYNDPGIFRRTMEVAALNRHPQLMLETARLWVEKEPNSTDALGALWGTLVLLGKYADAQPVMVRYLAQLPDDLRSRALLQLPQRFPAQADPRQVRILVDSVTAPYLNNPDALIARAQVAFRAGDDPAALASVQQARKLQPDSEAALLLNVQVLAKLSPNQVLPTYSAYLARYPEAATVRALYAQQLINAGRAADARAEVARIVAQPDVAPEPLFATAAVAIQAQAPDLAIQALDRLLRVDTIDTSLIQYNLGLACEARADQERSGQTQSTQAAEAASLSDAEAIQHYLQVMPGEYQVAARLRAANLMVRRGNLVGAQTLLHNTQTRDARSRTDLAIGEAALLRENGDSAGALRLLEQAVAKDPNNNTLRYEYGMMAERQGKMAVFEQSMRTVIRRDPGYAQAYNALGFTLADRNVRLKESRTLLDKALSLAPNDPFILDSMGWLCYREKKLTAALDYLNRAAALRTDPEIMAHQVTVLLALNRGEDALRVWRAGTQQFPESPELKALAKAVAPGETPSPKSDR